MAKKDFSKGIDRVFSPTKTDDVKEVKEAGNATNLETRGTAGIDKRANEPEKAYANYNVKYPKELQKRIKRFCIENDGIDMRDVFIEGAIMYMDKYK